MELAELRALVDVVHDHFAPREDFRMELLLVGAVRSDGREERAGGDVARKEDGRPGRSARHAGVTLRDGGLEVLARDGGDPERSPEVLGEGFGAARLRIAEEEPLDRQNV